MEHSLYYWSPKEYFIINWGIEINLEIYSNILLLWIWLRKSTCRAELFSSETSFGYISYKRGRDSQHTPTHNPIMEIRIYYTLLSSLLFVIFVTRIASQGKQFLFYFSVFKNNSRPVTQRSHIMYTHNIIPRCTALKIKCYTIKQNR